MPTLLELILDPVSIGMFVLYGLLFAWESLFPARSLPRIQGWRLRTVLALVVYFAVSSYLPLLLSDALAPFRLWDVSALGTLGGAAVAFIAYEVLAYAWHRALHGWNVLWRGLHQMHHSAERLDVPSAFWFSPLDMAGWTLVSTLTLTVIGLSPGATFAFVMLATFLAIFQHSNIRTPRWLGYLVQRPENHSHHHARGYHFGNFANLSLLDIAFGTFRNHADFAPETGLGEGASRRVAEMLVFRDVSAREPHTSRAGGSTRGGEHALERPEATSVLQRR